MIRKIIAAVMFTLVLVTLLSFRVAGQGGVPPPSQIVALQQAVATLQTQLATVQAANSILQSQVTGLQTQVSGLQTTVSSNDAALQSQLTGLQNQQTTFGNTLNMIQNQNEVFVGRGQSGRLNNNLPAPVIASVSVPAGNYLIYAVAGALNTDTDDQTGQCALSTNANAFHNNSNSQSTPSDAIIRVQGIGSLCGAGTCDFWQAQLPLLDTATFTSDTTISVSCIGFNWFVAPTIVAVNVGNIH